MNEIIELWSYFYRVMFSAHPLDQSTALLFYVYQLTAVGLIGALMHWFSMRHLRPRLKDPDTITGFDVLAFILRAHVRFAIVGDVLWLVFLVALPCSHHLLRVIFGFIIAAGLHIGLLITFGYFLAGFWDNPISVLGVAKRIQKRFL